MSPRELSPEASAERWDEFTLAALRDRHPLAWLTDRWDAELSLYWRIMDNAPAHGRILEIGAGAGPNLLWLAARGYRCVGVEYRPKVVAAAKRLASQFDLDIGYGVGDAFELSGYRGFDVVFSVGMIEHWERDVTVRALREQAACATTVIAVVPTPHTHLTGEITDERFYRHRELRAIARDAGLTDVRSFGYGTIPDRRGRVARYAIPHALTRLIQDRSRVLSMAQGIIGRGSPA